MRPGRPPGRPPEKPDSRGRDRGSASIEFLGFLPILLLVALLVIFWLVVLRPARRQQQETRQLQSALEVGDRVVISAGIFGTVADLEEGRVRLEVAPGTVIVVARQAVLRKAPEDPAAAEEGSLDAEAEHPAAAEETPEPDEPIDEKD